MTKKKKQFDAVQMTRDIRGQIYEEIKDMDPEKIKTYFSRSKTKTKTSKVAALKKHIGLATGDSFLRKYLTGIYGR